MTLRHPIVMVIWHDSRQPEPSWQWLSDVSSADCSPVVCMSVGFLVKESPTAIGLALSIGDIAAEDVQVSGLKYIPKSCVQLIINLSNAALSNSNVEILTNMG